MKLPVYVDTRPAFVLFSWRASDGSLRFELIRDQERGTQRNVFLDRFINRRTLPLGLDLAALEERLKLLPTSAVVEWFIDDARSLSLPPPSVVQLIRRAIVRRKATLHLSDIKDWVA